MTFGPGYPAGIDCEWLATDRDGQLVVFFTAGCAPIPAKLLATGYFEAMRDGVDVLPPRTIPQLFVEWKRPDDLLHFGARGLFVFDWPDAGCTRTERECAYVLVAAPAEPITLDELPADLRTIAAVVTFDLSFRASQMIDVRAHFECAEPSPAL